MPPAEPTREQLLAELEALGEQVKLLTRTEQRLHRSQAAVDRQLSRIEALAEFSFRASATEETIEVAYRALEILANTFDVDAGYAATIGGGGPALRALGDAGETVSAEAVLTAADRVQTVRVFDLNDASIDVGAMRTTLDIRDAKTLVLIALRGAEGDVLGALVAWKGDRRPSYYKDDLTDAHDAYLFALASHAARAIEGTTLTGTLRSRSEELARSNAHLTRSLKELESAQAALLESQKMDAIARLAGGLAHDFNNLMTVVLGHIDFIDEELPKAPSKSALAEVRGAVQKASELTAQLLAFGREQPHRPVPTDLSTSVPQTLRSIVPALREDIAVSIESTPALPEVVIDRGHLDQILLNLVLNARDAMPDGGALWVRSRRSTHEDLDLVGIDSSATPSGYMALEVADSGEGMPQEVLDRMFEPFYTTKELGRGTGLGLASVHGLVRQNGGFIGANSAPDAGTRFVVLLPVVTAPSFQSRPDDRTAPRILLVEDDDGIRGLAARVLDRDGFHVTTARDGIEGLSVLERLGSVDLLITDVIMPRMGGAKLARRVRRQYGDVPVLYISGHPFDEIDVPSLDDGLTHYLAKPFTPGALRNAARAALAGTGVKWGG